MKANRNRNLYPAAPTAVTSASEMNFINLYKLLFQSSYEIKTHRKRKIIKVYKIQNNAPGAT